ncbi:MAG: hypothetical protein IPH71_09875 [Proteobacteria bacterium]|nr:hypothetical protein [Pseudomonadota bacterium]
MTDVRQGSAAEAAGVRTGDELLALDDIPIAKATQALEPVHLSRSDPLARDWALNVAVAGRHERSMRKLMLRAGSGAVERSVDFRAEATGEQPGLLQARRIGNVGYVRIHNSLGDNELVRAFDVALRGFAGVDWLHPGSSRHSLRRHGQRCPGTRGAFRLRRRAPTSGMSMWRKAVKPECRAFGWSRSRRVLPCWMPPSSCW